MRDSAGQSGARRCAARSLAAALGLAAAPPARAEAPGSALQPNREISPSAALRKLPAGICPPEIDGRLGDSAWEQATPLGPFTQQSPHEGAEPTYPTDVKVLYDDEHLYVAVRAWDPEPEKLITKVMRPDTSQRSDDRVLITIDTFHDQRNGYMFSSNPNSARREALIENNQTVREQWDGIWFAKARRDAEGWTVEFAFPSQVARLRPRADRLGLRRRARSPASRASSRASASTSCPTAPSEASPSATRTGSTFCRSASSAAAPRRSIPAWTSTTR